MDENCPDNREKWEKGTALTVKKRYKIALGAALLVLAVMSVIVLSYYTAKAYNYYKNHHSFWVGDSYVKSDPVLGYVATPNAKVKHIRHPIFSVYSDDRGGRVIGPGQRAPGKIDLLSVGCSFTWGHGIEDDDTYIKILGRMTGLTAYNAGVASYGPITSFLTIARYADMRPRIVVYGFIREHSYRSLSPFADGAGIFPRPQPFIDFDPQGRPFIHGPLAESKKYCSYLRDVILDDRFNLKDVYWAGYRDYLILTNTAFRQTGFYQDAEGKKWLDLYYERTKNPDLLLSADEYVLGLMSETCKKIGAKLIVVYIPSSIPVLPAPGELIRAIGSCSKYNNVYYVDMTNSFKLEEQEHGADSIFLANDGHPTALANRLIAENLEPVVKKILAVDKKNETNNG